MANVCCYKTSFSKIRQWFKKNNREEHVNLGKTNLEHELTKAVFDDYVKSGEFDKVAKTMNYQSAEDLFAALGYGETTITKVLNKLKNQLKRNQKKHFTLLAEKAHIKILLGWKDYCILLLIAVLQFQESQLLVL